MLPFLLLGLLAVGGAAAARAAKDPDKKRDDDDDGDDRRSSRHYQSLLNSPLTFKTKSTGILAGMHWDPDTLRFKSDDDEDKDPYKNLFHPIKTPCYYTNLLSRPESDKEPTPKFTFEPYVPKHYSLPEPIGYKPFHVKEAERRERDTHEAINALWGRHNRALSIRSIIEKGDEASSTDLERACTPRPFDNHIPSDPFCLPGREPLPMGPF